MIKIKAQPQRKNAKYLIAAAKSLLASLLCGLFVYLICTLLTASQYQTRTYFTVGYNHLPEGFYDRLIDDEPINLVNEMEDILHDESIFEIAAGYAFSDMDTVKSALSVTNAGGNQYETIIITCTGNEPHQVYSIISGYVRALDEVLTFGPAKPNRYSSAELSESSTNIYAPAPYPTEDLSPSSLPFAVFTGIVVFAAGYVFFSRKDAFSSIASFVSFLLIFLFVFPFYYLIIGSISDNPLSSPEKILFLPHNVHVNHYAALFSQQTIGIPASIAVTLAKTILVSFLSVFISAWAGYLFTFKNLWHRRFWYYFVMITMFFEAGLMPWLMNMEMLGLKNNFLGLILPGIVVPCGIMLVKNHVESIPASIRESAYMDGFGIWQYFLRIVLPMSSPLLIALCLFSGLKNWNSFLDSFLLMTENEALQTLSHKLYLVINQSGFKDISALPFGGSLPAEEAKQLLLPITVLISVPVFLVYPLVHRRLLNGIKLGMQKM